MTHKHRHRHHHEKQPPGPITDLFIIFRRGHCHRHHHHHRGCMSNNTLNFNLPATYADGTTPLPIANIASFTVTAAAGSGNVSPPATVNGPFTALAQTFVDNAPDFGQTETYTVIVTDNDGQVAAGVSGSVNVGQPAQQAPGPITGLTITFNP